jgi:hypothetical protein
MVLVYYTLMFNFKKPRPAYKRDRNLIVSTGKILMQLESADIPAIGILVPWL